MITIKKSDKSKGFRVVISADNGEPLSVTETFKSKQSAWKNITSQMYQLNSNACLVVDATNKTHVMYRLYENGGKEKLPIKIRNSKTNTVNNTK